MGELSDGYGYGLVVDLSGKIYFIGIKENFGAGDPDKFLVFLIEIQF
ncbi:MAG: hypothetical protein ACFFEN_06150 [Candidatus Thorarchaeota archaeon]